eukprot:NODE_63_length_25098_cov_0.440498.p12 type:complete len:245 gc:universal NODE_63_length_25098_cov_0.440498:15941-15207(-)
MIKLTRRHAVLPTIFELDSQIDKLLPNDFVEENVPIESVLKMFYIKELGDPIVQPWQTKQNLWKTEGKIRDRVSLLDHLIFLNSNIKSENDLHLIYKSFVEPFTSSVQDNQYVADDGVDLPIDKYGRISGYGSRKTAIANVWLVHNPKIISEYSALINNRPLHDYFVNPSDRQSILIPFEIAHLHWDSVNRGLDTDVYGSFKIFATTSGGGVSGQASSIRMGIARALAKWHSFLVPYFQECTIC